MIAVMAILCLFIVSVAVYVVFSRSILSAIIAMGVFSMIVSALFVVLRAPDVAMTEAVIGAGLITAFLIIALDKTNESEPGEERDQ